MNTSEGTKKGRVTEQRTANVQMSRTIEVVQASQPIYTEIKLFNGSLLFFL